MGFPPALGMTVRLSKAELTLAGEGDSETERVEMLSSAPRPKTHFHPEQIPSNSTCILLPLEPVAFHWKAEWKQELWGWSQPCPGPACFLLAEP